LPLQNQVGGDAGAALAIAILIDLMNTLRGNTIGFSAAVAEACAPQQLTTDLRVYERRSADQCQWLQRARVKYGPDVHVVDISKGGVLIETAGELTCHGRVIFEFSGPDTRILVPSRVVRAGLEVVGGAAVYRGGYAFERPLLLANATTRDGAGLLPADDAARRATPSIGESDYQKIVARYWDGLLLRGYTNDFHPSKAHLHLSSHPTAGAAALVPLSQLKALFFVREFAGNPGHVEENQFVARPPGRKIEVTFRDGEVLVGSTLNYRPDGQGFFVQPADPRSNNLRVFVTHAAIRHIRFV
jgi:hypothetical protein